MTTAQKRSIPLWLLVSLILIASFFFGRYMKRHHGWHIETPTTTAASATISNGATVQRTPAASTMGSLGNAAKPTGSFESERDVEPMFSKYAASERHTGKNHSLVMDEFGRSFKTRLREALASGKPEFAGKYILARWGCGTSGCNTGGIIDAATGQAYPLPVSLFSVYPLKPQFEQEAGQELHYRLDSRLMVFAGGLDGAAQGNGSDTVEFHEFKNGAFIFIKAMPYGRLDSSQ